MFDVEFFSAILVPLIVAMIGVIGTQLLIFYRLKKELSAQQRVKYFKEGFADNFNIQFYLTEIEVGQNLELNVKNIQDILDVRSYNVSIGFLLNWTSYKKSLFKDNTQEQKKVIQLLLDNLSGTLKLYAIKHLKDVLGFSKDEINRYIEAMKGKIEQI